MVMPVPTNDCAMLAGESESFVRSVTDSPPASAPSPTNSTKLNPPGPLCSRNTTPLFIPLLLASTSQTCVGVNVVNTEHDCPGVNV